MLGLPALVALRKRFPDRQITVMSGRSTAELIELANVANDQIVVDREALRQGKKLASIAKIFELTRDVRSRGFELVVDLHSLYETNILGLLSGAKTRLYGNRESRSLDRLANFPTAPPREDKSKHLTERYLDVIIPLGIDDAERLINITPRPEDIAEVFRKFPVLVRDTKRLVGLFPGAGNPSRCWSLEKFAKTARRFTDLDHLPLVFLGPEERGLRDSVHDLFPEGTPIIDGLSLSEFLAAVSGLDCFITNDTGPLHLAAVVDVPIVLVIDARAPRTYIPIASHMSIVSKTPIDEIGVDEVFSEAAAYLANDISMSK
ncbi:MAG: glycosyltransferase family 9 protein [Acidobacteriota bacterium]